MKRKFDIDAFRNLPGDLKKSDYVDFLLFLNRDKPCIRIGNNTVVVYEKLKKWCQKYGYSFRLSSYGLVYISRKKMLGYLAQKVDDSTFSHTLLFGILLGYPVCCCLKIKSIGEENIDDYENNVLREMEKLFIRPYDRIKPHNYLEGAAYISHIPCSSRCEKSLKIANRTYNVIKKYENEECMRRWKNVL